MRVQVYLFVVNSQPFEINNQVSLEEEKERAI